MFHMGDSDINRIVHELIYISYILKKVHVESLSVEDKTVMCNCEKRLELVRQQIIECIEEDTNGEPT